MVCDICKHNQATVHLTEIVDDEMSELHLCESCANEKGAQMESHFGLAELLAGLADFGGQSTETDTPTAADACTQCGMTYADFKKSGRLGCSACYTVFRQSLAGLLRRIHGSVSHVGKVPRHAEGVQRKIGSTQMQQLRHQLEEAINAEQFEQAAVLRDQLRTLEQAKPKPKPKPKTQTRSATKSKAKPQQKPKS
jgi:protein arginine kinase activator